MCGVYIREDFDSEHYNFLRRDVLPLFSKICLWSVDRTIPERLAVFDTLGITEVLAEVDDSVVRMPVRDCSRPQLHYLVCAVGSEVQRYLNRYQAQMRALETPKKRTQFQLFSNRFSC